MEYQGRRNRRGRDRRSRQAVPPSAFAAPNTQRRWSIMDGLSSIFIMASLLAIIYLMLDYHCTACNARCDLTNITRNINDISKNISYMKKSYSDLEKEIIKFSHELPKIEGQIEILESIANTMESGDVHRQAKKKSPETLNVVTPKYGSPGNVTDFQNKTKSKSKSEVEQD